MPRINEDEIIVKEELNEDGVQAQPIIKKKIRNFSEKYDKGKQIGSGPFGHVYHCWVRDD